MKRSSYAAPYGIWMVMFTIVPLLFVVYFAFTSKTGAFTFDNFEKFMKPMYLEALFLSLKLAFFCTVICFLIGYPAAKFLASKDFSKNKPFFHLAGTRVSRNAARGGEGRGREGCAFL